MARQALNDSRRVDISPAHLPRARSPKRTGTLHVKPYAENGVGLQARGRAAHLSEKWSGFPWMVKKVLYPARPITNGG